MGAGVRNRGVEKVMMTNRIAGCLLAAAGAVLALPAEAAIVTLYGDDVSFTFDDASLFGSATVVGNSLVFSPTNFRAESTNEAGSDLVSETLNIEVEVTTPGVRIGGLALVEKGDYRLDGGDASVTASGRLQVVSRTQTDGLFPLNGSTIFNATGLTTQGATTGWSGSAAVDITGWGGDTSVRAQIQNNLSATTLQNGEAAWIEKKLGDVSLDVTLVPVPAALWLFGSGLLGLVGVARRRR